MGAEAPASICSPAKGSPTVDFIRLLGGGASSVPLAEVS